jgi:hypothetical protein
MTFLDDCLDGRSQHFTFPRRELLQKIASAALLFFVPRSQPVFEVPKKYPASKFAIGNQIFSPWDDGDLDFDEDEEYDIPPEFGEIMGVCWNPKNEAWEYIINWTSGDAADWMYPMFDEVLICESSLRLVSHD